MNYPLEFRKFISSQYLYAGIRITAGAIIPAIILYQYDVLPTLIGIPLGAMFTSLADNPGPPHHRRNGMLISLVLNFIIVIIAGYSRVYPWLIGIEIIVFGILFSLIAIFGNRANSIGLIALIVFILHVDKNQPATHILLQGVFLVTGGLWYAALSLILYTLRPYRAVQQLLGECLMEMSAYFNRRALFYKKDADLTRVYNDLFEHQVKIHYHQEELREMLFSTRRFITESTRKGRVLMMIFLDSVDLLERIMAAQQDYAQLHKDFEDTEILGQFYKNIKILANTLHQIGLAVQSGESVTGGADIEAQYQQSFDAFHKLRSTNMNAENVEGFIQLRHILYSMQDVTEKIQRFKVYTSFDKTISKKFKTDLDLQQFKPHREINFNLLLANLSFKSSAFRHAIRLTFALLIGYIISLLFTIGHGYWILLTIALIIKPAYSLTKERNIQRLWGTFAGALAGFGLLYFSPDNSAIFIIMVLAMILSYSFLKLNYGFSTAGLTTFLLLSFHFMDPNGTQQVLLDRVIDTAIGCVIAYIVSFLVLPTWEHEQFDKLMVTAIEANNKYFNSIAASFIGRPVNITTYKISRKEAFVALANLSDTFQRMISEPKSQTKYLPQYHQFVAANHMLSSHIASLSYYAQHFGPKFNHPGFEPIIKTINRQFQKALAPEKNEEIILPSNTPLPINKKVQQLLDLRKNELEKEFVTDSRKAEKTISDLKTITDQFRLIYATIGDEIRILNQIQKEVKGER